MRFTPQVRIHQVATILVFAGFEGFTLSVLKFIACCG